MVHSNQSTAHSRVFDSLKTTLFKGYSMHVKSMCIYTSITSVRLNYVVTDGASVIYVPDKVFV